MKERIIIVSGLIAALIIAYFVTDRIGDNDYSDGYYYGRSTGFSDGVKEGWDAGFLSVRPYNHRPCPECEDCKHVEFMIFTWGDDESDVDYMYKAMSYVQSHDAIVFLVHDTPFDFDKSFICRGEVCFNMKSWGAIVTKGNCNTR